jgi:hypothetical protein
LAGQLGSDLRLIGCADVEHELNVRGVCLGGEEFIRTHTAELSAEREIPRSHWQPLRPSLDELFATESDPLVAAYHEWGYTMRSIAEHVGCHYSTISRRLHKAERARGHDHT